MANKDKPKQKVSAGARALRTTIPKRANYPLIIRFIFECEQCGKAIFIKDRTKFWTALSMEHAQELLAAFAKDREPRTITCSCGHEAEYRQEDVGFSWD